MTQRSTSDRFRDEADQVLGTGLMAVLSRHGEVHVVGSYALGLMTWRDLDVHLVREDVSVEDFFGLGGRIASLLKPHRMHFRDETTVATKGCHPISIVGCTWEMSAPALGRSMSG